MRSLLLFIRSLLLFPVVTCLTKLEYCGDSIQSAIGSFTFVSDTAEDYWANLCINELGVLSMGAAVKKYCTNPETFPGWSIIQKYCAENAYNLTDWDNLSDSLTDDFVHTLQVVEFEDIDETKTWNNSVLLSEDFYTTSYRTSAVFTREYELHHYYGWSIYGFWGIVLLFGITQKLYSTLVSRKSQGSRLTEESGDIRVHLLSNTLRTSIIPWLHTNLVVPATFGNHHQRPLWYCTIPTRIESLVVGSFYVLNLIVCCVTYEIFYPNLYYTKPIQVWRYVSDRTGIIAYANLPWLWMFSGRNNIFILLTGWRFSTFNVFHRHIARIATIQAVVHSIGYTAIEINYHELAASWKEKYWYMGGMATIVMSLLLGLSSLWMRRKVYEVFLIIHITFAVLVIVGLFYHTAIWEGEYDGYLWPLVAIWLFDRLARLARLIYCNVHLSFSNSHLKSEAKVTYKRDEHMLEVKISPSSRHLRPAPGHHYYIYQQAGWKLWENHPFTLASWTSLRNKVTSISINLPEKNIEKIAIAMPKRQEGPPGGSLTAHHDSQCEDPPNSEELFFYIRPYDSWTRRLQSSCLKELDHSIQTKVLIEGPYGGRAPLHRFENVVYIVGGSGMTAALPYLQEFVVNRCQSSNMTREVTLIWATRQPGMVHNIVEHNLKPLLSLENVHCHFHVTSGTAAGPQSPHAVTANALNLQYNSSRPDVHAYISAVAGDVAEAGKIGGRVAVFVCGPAAMADEARASVHGALQIHKERVDVRYFEESFG